MREPREAKHDGRPFPPGRRHVLVKSATERRSGPCGLPDSAIMTAAPLFSPEGNLARAVKNRAGPSPSRIRDGPLSFSTSLLVALDEYVAVDPRPPAHQNRPDSCNILR